MAPISLSLLQSLLVFSRSRNLIEAAKKLGISQPALTKQFQQLETQLPHKIFTQLGRKKVLTPYGVQLCEQLEKNLAPIHNLIKQVNDQYASPENIVVRIAGRQEILRRIALKTEFRGKLHFLSQSSEEALQNLVDRKVEIAITHLRPDSSVLHSKVFLKDRFHVLYPKNWAHVTHVKDLLTLPFLSYKENSFHQKDLVNLVPHRMISDWQTLVQMVENKQGWAVVPTSFVFDKKLCGTLSFSSSLEEENKFYLLYNFDSAQLNGFKELITKLLS